MENLNSYLQNLQEAYPQHNIDSLRKQSGGFVEAILRKGWFVDSRAVVSGEGGKNSMLLNALTEILLADGDVELGFGNYMRFLAEVYGTGRQENLQVSLDELIAQTFGGERGLYDKRLLNENLGNDSPLVVESESPSGWLLTTLSEVKRADGPRLGPPPFADIDQGDMDFLDTYAHVGSVVEAAALSLRPYERCRQVLRNLRRWVSRHPEVGPPAVSPV